MAYENQIKCIGCGISIPDVPENFEKEELLCDRCEKIGEVIGGIEALAEPKDNSLGNALPPLALDGLVDHIASKVGSTVNNGGFRSQVEYLLDNGVDADEILGVCKIAREDD